MMPENGATPDDVLRTAMCFALRHADMPIAANRDAEEKRLAVSTQVAPDFAEDIARRR